MVRLNALRDTIIMVFARTTPIEMHRTNELS